MRCGISALHFAAIKTMSEYCVVPVDYEGEILRNQWLDLWRFNQFQAPKYWFGDKVKFHGFDGAILGMEWRPDAMPLPSGGEMKSGWWLLVKWERMQSTHKVHEDSVSDGN
jgi:hypothetical protein